MMHMNTHETLVVADDDVPVGVLCHRSTLRRGGAASGCRGLGQRARWAPAVKDTDEPIHHRLYALSAVRAVR
jgi:hypothetical protein